MGQREAVEATAWSSLRLHRVNLVIINRVLALVFYLSQLCNLLCRLLVDRICALLVSTPVGPKLAPRALSDSTLPMQMSRPALHVRPASTTTSSLTDPLLSVYHALLEVMRVRRLVHLLVFSALVVCTQLLDRRVVLRVRPVCFHLWRDLQYALLVLLEVMQMKYLVHLLVYLVRLVNILLLDQQFVPLVLQDLTHFHLGSRLALLVSPALIPRVVLRRVSLVRPIQLRPVLLIIALLYE